MMVRWKERFLQHGHHGPDAGAAAGRKPSVRTPKLHAKVLDAIKEGPKAGSVHLSHQKLASRLDQVGGLVLEIRIAYINSRTRLFF